MAEQDSTATPQAAGKGKNEANEADKGNKDFERRARAAERDAARIEDDRRDALILAETENYARALGAPIVKGE